MGGARLSSFFVPDLIAGEKPYWRYLPIISYLVSAMWLIGWFYYGYGYFEDDAFIHLEFARSLSQGRGFAFGSHVVYGDTSPLWVFLLAATHHFVIDWIEAGKVLSAVSCVAALVALFPSAAALAPETMSRRDFAAITTLLITLNPYFTFWFLSGMEVLLAIAVGLWILWACSTEPMTWFKFWLGSVLCGIAPLLRPELFFLDIFAVPFLLWRIVKRLDDRFVGTRLLVCGLAILTAVGPLLVWMTYAHYTFGVMVPTTNAAKRVFDNGSVVRRLAVIITFGFPLLSAFLIGLPIYALISWLTDKTSFDRLIVRCGELPAAAKIIAAWCFFTCIFYIGNRTYVQTRYALLLGVPLTIPVLSLVFRAGSRSIGIVACIGAGLAALVVSLTIARPLTRNKAEILTRTAQLADFIRASLPPQASVATFAIGQLAFQSRHRIVDMGGITNTDAVPYLSPSLQMKWAVGQGAAYLIGGEDDTPGPGAVVIYQMNLPFAQWTLDARDFSGVTNVRLWALRNVHL